MSRRFRLQTLERLRAARLDTAAEALACARAELTAAEREHEELVLATLACVPPAQAGPQDVVLAGLRRDLLREKANRAAQVIVTRQGEVSRAVEEWHSARSQLRAVEALHERHRIAIAMERVRAEQRLIDDLAGTRGPVRPVGGDQR